MRTFAKLFIRIFVVPLAGLLCSHTALAIAHANDWYPEKQLAEWLMASPTLLQIEWVQWGLLAVATLVFWVAAEYLFYRRQLHAAPARRADLVTDVIGRSSNVEPESASPGTARHDVLAQFLLAADDLMNRKVTSKTKLDKWKRNYQKWHTDVTNYLRDNMSASAAYNFTNRGMIVVVEMKRS
jgi:hypothetical protein